jgi:hypothetical protein
MSLNHASIAKSDSIRIQRAAIILRHVRHSEFDRLSGRASTDWVQH